MYEFNPDAQRDSDVTETKSKTRKVIYNIGEGTIKDAKHKKYIRKIEMKTTLF